MPCERLAQHPVLVAGVDQDGRPPAPHQERVALPHVQHDDLVARKARGDDDRPDHDARRRRDQTERATTARTRPRQPQRRRACRRRQKRPGEGHARRQARVGDARERAHDGSEGACAHRRESDQRRRDGRNGQGCQHRREPAGADYGKQRRGRYVGQRRHNRHLREQRCGERRGRKARSGGKRERLARQARSALEALRDPRLEKPCEQYDAERRERRQRERDRQRRARIERDAADHAYGQRAERRRPPPRREREHAGERHDGRAHGRRGRGRQHEEAQQKRRLQDGSGAPGNAQRTQERGCAAGDDGQVRPRHRHEMRKPAGLVGGVRVTYLEGAAPSAHERGEHRGPVVGPLIGDQVDRAIAKPCQDTEGVGTLAAHDSARRAFEHRALPPAVCRRRPARRGERRVGLQHVAVTRRVLAFLEPKPHRNGSDVGKVRAREARCAIRALRTVGCDFESPASRKAVALQLRLVLRGRAPACERDAERGSQQRGPRDRHRQPP